MTIKTQQQAVVLHVTDVNKVINRNGEFGIEVNHQWVLVNAADFFDYLYNCGRIDGHDPEAGTAWTQYGDGYWSHQRQEYVEDARFQTRSYEEWLQEIDDEEFMDYLTPQETQAIFS